MVTVQQLVLHLVNIFSLVQKTENLNLWLAGIDLWQAGLELQRAGSRFAAGRVSICSRPTDQI